MKLFWTPTSPYARKVMVVAREVGAPIETTFLRPTPLRADESLSKENPLNKIPVLVTPEGPLYDSPVICEYLDARHELVPAAGPERFRVLRLQALCDGILEAGVLVYYERADRPKELHWQAWLDGQTQKARQGLDALEAEAEQLARSSAVDLAQICAGVTIGWLEFRNPFGDLRAGRPELFRWYDAFRERPSMKETEPHG